MKRKLLTGFFVLSLLVTGLVLFANFERQFRSTYWTASADITRRPHSKSISQMLDVKERLYQEFEYFESERRISSLLLGACAAVASVLWLLRLGRFALRSLLLSVLAAGLLAAIPYLKVHAVGPPEGSVHYFISGLRGPSHERSRIANLIERRLKIENALPHMSPEMRELAREHRVSIRRMIVAAIDDRFQIYVSFESEKPLSMDQMKSFVAFYVQYADVLAGEILPENVTPLKVVPADSEWAQRHAATFETEYRARIAEEAKQETKNETE